MLAIIIPYYKLTYFEETLQSLVLQTNKNFKVYIGNDNSPECPDNLLKAIERKFDFEYKKFENNLGSISLTKHWHRCIDLINFEQWIMILGDDDVLSENTVEEFYKNLNTINNNNIKVIRFSSQLIDSESNSYSKVFTHDKIESANMFFYNKIKGLTRSSLSEYIFDAETIKNIGFYDLPLAWHSDDLAILECSNFNNIFTINEAKLSVRVSNLSISGNKNLEAEKTNASMLFYQKLYNTHIDKFSKQNQKIIVLKNESFFKYNKNLIEYFKLCKFHFIRFGFMSFLKFNRRIYLNRK